MGLEKIFAPTSSPSHQCRPPVRNVAGGVGSRVVGKCGKPLLHQPFDSFFLNVVYFILVFKAVKILNRNLPPVISTSGCLFCDWHQTDQTHTLPYNTRPNHWISLLNTGQKLVEFPNANPEEKLPWIMISQYVEGIGTTHLMVLNFVVKDFESWQISQGAVKSINYKLRNLGQRKFITVHLANMIKVFSVLIWWCLTTVHKEWRFSLEITDVTGHIWREELLSDH